MLKRFSSALHDVYIIEDETKWLNVFAAFYLIKAHSKNRILLTKYKTKS